MLFYLVAIVSLYFLYVAIIIISGSNILELEVLVAFDAIFYQLLHRLQQLMGWSILARTLAKQQPNRVGCTSLHGFLYSHLQAFVVPIESWFHPL